MKYAAFALLAGAALCLAGARADEPLKSGPQAGDDIPGPFHPFNVTGEQAGKKHCLFCENGAGPVAIVFARTVTPSVTRLIKKIDAETLKNKKAGMGSFAVFLSSNDKLAKELAALATKENIKATILTIDSPAGPTRYKIARDAAVTVVLYSDFTVRASHAFRKGELSDKGIGQVAQSLPKIFDSK
ncbi:MAG: hypothetical protein FJ271_16105 [Planctomycetes bacterium]|nr:hypothetical protein [Planctomycetota bacterium]